MTGTELNLDADISTLSKDDFALLFDNYLETRDIKEQTVVQGKVISINSDWVTVDVGYKAEGAISRSEFVGEDGEVTISIGDDIDVFLGHMNENDGELRLSKRRADEMKAWDVISDAFDEERTVKGVIVARVKGGLSVDIGVKAFLPGSQVDLRPVKNLERLLNEELEFKIIKFN